MSDQLTSGPSRPWGHALVAAVTMRTLVLTSPLLAVGCTWLAAHRTMPAVGIVLVLLAAACAARPDSHLGLLVVVVIGIQWLATVHNRTTPWSVGAAVALAVFHASMAAATVASPAAPWTRAMCRRWVRRLVILIAGSAGTWLIVSAVNRHRPASGSVLVVASLVALAIAGLWARDGTIRAHPPE
ncbi:MAG: hypothetical protein ABI862_09680 [Ilumatobacteraceae bacterium]